VHPIAAGLGALAAGVLLCCYVRRKLRHGTDLQNEPLLSKSETERNNDNNRGVFSSSGCIVYQDLNFEETIGRGAEGIVRRGRWEGFDVAIKVIIIGVSEKQAEVTQVVDAARKEAEIHQRLRHPHIVIFYGLATKVGSMDVKLAIVMELCACSLRDYLKSCDEQEKNAKEKKLKQDGERQGVQTMLTILIQVRCDNGTTFVLIALPHLHCSPPFTRWSEGWHICTGKRSYTAT
jgi:hypothetical protein